MAKHAKKWIFGSALTALAGVMALPTAASAQNEAALNDIEAERVPGNDDLKQGKVTEAIAALEAARRAEGNDPAILINLGQAYARAGDHGKARKMLIKARDNRRDYDMMLSSGEVISSRDAAVAALRWLDAQVQTAQLDVRR
ncbi:tetratricopeptide repeat protein [Alterisphingorhabdus coralli]|uniref:Tetratricopeptide repeat protein n=1 Tax=Alterisphingorhabdus coralli TaxID=3071408 RepID=A0AA97F7J6_9SPHN|nr:tetratricopeptide repeat protein [Parasphingorhabdus sp. SCSIO 66989]WOE75834.1 tetratricopeptide repeat protein [Parasphingorhabdus sp. SCSIO 66989]